jgi:hypothetical protein
MFDEPITPSSGPEIFIIRGDGGLVGEFTVLDAEGNPGITLPNSVGEAVSIALQSQFLTWPLTNNVNFAVSGGFPSFGTQDRILALDITEGAMASIGGLRFGTIGDSGCDYVYEILAVKPAAPPAVPALGGLGLLALAGAMLYAGTRRTNARG